MSGSEGWWSSERVEWNEESTQTLKSVYDEVKRRVQRANDPTKPFIDTPATRELLDGYVKELHSDALSEARFANRKLTVALCGGMGVGKSSILNALLANEPLPDPKKGNNSEANPAFSHVHHNQTTGVTRVVLAFEYAPKGETHPLELDDIEDLRELSKRIQSLTETATQQGEKRLNFKHRAFLALQGRGEDSPGIVLLDIPGFEEDLKVHIKEGLHTADVIMMPLKSYGRANFYEPDTFVKLHEVCVFERNSEDGKPLPLPLIVHVHNAGMVRGDMDFPMDCLIASMKTDTLLRESFGVSVQVAFGSAVVTFDLKALMNEINGTQESQAFCNARKKELEHGPLITMTRDAAPYEVALHIYNTTKIVSMSPILGDGDDANFLAKRNRDVLWAVHDAARKELNNLCMSRAMRCAQNAVNKCITIANSRLPKQNMLSSLQDLVQKARTITKLPGGKRAVIIPPVEYDGIQKEMWGAAFGALTSHWRDSNAENVDIQPTLSACCIGMYASMSEMVHDFLTLVHKRVSANEFKEKKKEELRKWVLNQLRNVLDEDWPADYKFESFVQHQSWQSAHWPPFYETGVVIEETWNRILTEFTVEDICDAAKKAESENEKDYDLHSGLRALFVYVLQSAFSDEKALQTTEPSEHDNGSSILKKIMESEYLKSARAACKSLVQNVMGTLDTYDKWFTNDEYENAAEIHTILKSLLSQIRKFGGGSTGANIARANEDVGLTERPLPPTTKKEGNNCVRIPSTTELVRVKGTSQKKKASDIMKEHTTCFDHLDFAVGKWLHANNRNLKSPTGGSALSPFLLENVRVKLDDKKDDYDTSTCKLVIDQMDAVLRKGKAISKLKSEFVISTENTTGMVACNVQLDGSISFEWKEEVLKKAIAASTSPLSIPKQPATEASGKARDPKRFVNPVLILPKLRYLAQDDWDDNILSTWTQLHESFKFCEVTEKSPVHYSVFIFAENDYAVELSRRLQDHEELNNRMFIVELPQSPLGAEDGLSGAALGPGYVWTVAMMFAEAFADYDKDKDTGFQSAYHMQYGDVAEFQEFKMVLGTRPRPEPHKGAACRALVYMQNVLEKEAYSTEGAAERLKHLANTDSFFDIGIANKTITNKEWSNDIIQSMLNADDQLLAWPHIFIKKIAEISPEAADLVKLAIWNGRQESVSQVALSNLNETNQFFKDLQGSAEGVAFYKVSQVRYRSLLMNAVALRGLHYICDEAMKPEFQLPKECRQAIVNYTAGRKDLKDVDKTRYDHLVFHSDRGRIPSLNFTSCKKSVMFAFMVAFMYGHGQWDSAHILYQMLLNKSGFTVFAFTYKRKAPKVPKDKAGFQPVLWSTVDEEVNDYILKLNWDEIKTPNDLVRQMIAKHKDKQEQPEAESRKEHDEGGPSNLGRRKIRDTEPPPKRIRFVFGEP